MRPVSRYGIEIDVCPTSGGVWLDKGELEKLMSIVKEAAEEARSMTQGNREGFFRGRDDDDDDDDDRYKHRPSNYGSSHDPKYNKGSYKKKSSLSKMMDIFDF
jgi:Zn-finger nucleic acid-binding protein